uniref:Pesticidal crystal protein N-terminal domain-containing protein n=1 Tax=Mucochytrium quahogii TaxID=96639 RepID=A0A7S2WKA1_9STRA|mmetsp:Transcript_33135/g.53230  ORF Transcript_33135/g.53230 Transcript_33135/m.53230 type:complete len:810 (-) Transcript_33135:245-2674(-)|eukprot:CAMPEP_0203748084 /NCGR_PEP_ID=MMETSP0098-20131031/3051_1 /ASSEMBLY_ACC=CAM_ASM_000208 /TAXON_ID=96639 /ORGANISM=" , Strain NY0313808BC1" /LENGTH=809 /DNA_ID=CAMNT_0050636701 /DNA_START=381 /DNA_END=2810 /DNA_ORIENTATION=-
MVKLFPQILCIGLLLQLSAACKNDNDCSPGEFCTIQVHESKAIRGQVQEHGHCMQVHDRRMLDEEVSVEMDGLAASNIVKVILGLGLKQIPGVGEVAFALLEIFWPSVEKKESPQLERSDVLRMIEDRLKKASWDILKDVLGDSRDDLRDSMLRLATGGYVGDEQDSLVEATFQKALRFRNQVISFIEQLDAHNSVLKRGDSPQLINYLIVTNSLMVATYRLKHEHMLRKRGDPKMSATVAGELEHNIGALTKNMKHDYEDLQTRTENLYFEWVDWRQEQLDFKFDECVETIPRCGGLPFNRDFDCVKSRLFSVYDSVTVTNFSSEFVYNPLAAPTPKRYQEQYQEDIRNRIMNDLKATVLVEMAETLFLQRLIPGQEHAALDKRTLARALQHAKLGPYNAWTLGFAVGYDEKTKLWYKKRGDEPTTHEGKNWCHWGGARKKLSKATCSLPQLSIDGVSIVKQKSWSPKITCVCANSETNRSGLTCQSEGYAFMQERLHSNVEKIFGGPFKSVGVEPSKLKFGLYKDLPLQPVAGIDDYFYSRNEFSDGRAPDFTGLELYFDKMSGNIANLRVLAAARGHVNARYFTSNQGRRKQPLRFARASLSPNFRMTQVKNRKSTFQEHDAYLGYSIEVGFEFHEPVEYAKNVDFGSASTYTGFKERNKDTDSAYWAKFDWHATTPDSSPFLVSPNGKHKLLVKAYGMSKFVQQYNIINPQNAEDQRPDIVVRSFCFKDSKGQSCGCHEFAKSDLTRINSLGLFGLPGAHELPIYGEIPELTNDGELVLRGVGHARSKITHLVASADCPSSSTAT